VLSKATTVAAVLFMVTSIVLGIIATRRGGVGNSVLDRGTPAKQAPAKPGAPTRTVPAPITPGQPVPITITPQPVDQKGGPPAPAQPAPAGKK
jgi:hypothetical protein